jgi:hypothetical protein
VIWNAVLMRLVIVSEKWDASEKSAAGRCTRRRHGARWRLLQHGSGRFRAAFLVNSYSLTALRIHSRFAVVSRHPVGRIALQTGLPFVSKPKRKQVFQPRPIAVKNFVLQDVLTAPARSATIMM